MSSQSITYRFLVALCLALSQQVLAAPAPAPVLQAPTITFQPPAITGEAFLESANTYLNPNNDVIESEATQTRSSDPVADYTPASLVPPGYEPVGGLGVNVTNPDYTATSDYDRQSLILALYQAWAELEFLHQGFSVYSDQDFHSAGLMAADRHLLDHIANQEAGHAMAITKLLGGSGPKRCSYNFPHQDVREYIDFGQRLTRWGESTVYGFMSHLDSREAASRMVQSVSTEARQQMLFRQWNGLHPMPVLFEAGIPQSWGWTFLAPYISHCNASIERVMWQNFPKLTIINQPNPARKDASESWNETRQDAAGTQSTEGLSYDEACGQLCAPSIAHDRAKPLSSVGRDVFLQWDAPGEPVGPDNSYSTSILAGMPLYAAWVSGTKVTYTPLLDVQGNSAHTYQPNVTTYGGVPTINGTMYIAITDAEADVQGFNLHLLNPHVIALGMYGAG